jgi:hypothetical protein
MRSSRLSKSIGARIKLPMLKAIGNRDPRFWHSAVVSAAI